MPVAASAKRYAQAVFEIAREQNTFDQWLADLARLATLAEDPSFQLIMASPRVRIDQKTEILQERLEGVSPLARNLAQLLVVKGRVEIIPALLQECRRLVDTHRGVVHARVTTAVPLEPAAEEAVARQLAQLTGKQIVLTAEVDPRIVGGLVARLGDTLIDGSTRGRLENLRRELAGA